MLERFPPIQKRAMRFVPGQNRNATSNLDGVIPLE
jgi:hypothetical protein